MYSLDQKIDSLIREIGLRERVYPKWVLAGRMTSDQADKEIAVFKEILADYKAKLPTKQTSLFH